MPIGPGTKIFHSVTWGVDYCWWNGGYIPVSMIPKLEAAAKEAKWGTVRLSQGGLSGIVRASAYTHVGLGAVDIAIDGRSKAKCWAFAYWSLLSGVIMFLRGFVADSFQNNKHAHTLNYPTKGEHPEARAQAVEFRVHHGDGLVGSRGFTGPKPVKGPPYMETWDESPLNPKNIKRYKRRSYYVNVAKSTKAQKHYLMGLGVMRDDLGYHRERGYRILSDHMVYRWGRWNVVSTHGTYYALAYMTTTKPKG